MERDNGIDRAGRPAGRRVGHGYAIAHHGELLQGMFVGPNGPMRGLVTLPCQLYSSQGEFRPGDAPGIEVTPEWKWKAQKAAQLTLDYLEADGVGGVLRVDTTIPIVAAETASDSIMFGDRALLFAQRDALVIEDFGAHFPAFEVLGFNAGNAVDTLSFTPAQYDDRDIGRFEELRGLLRDGLRTGDTAKVGYVATTSSRINQRFLPKSDFDALLKLVGAAGAVGVQVAHSGSVVGVLFDGDDEDLEVRIEKGRAGLGELGIGPTWRFTTRLREPDPAQP
jgi:uncharacterized protein involved in propanediol utilization